MHSAGTWKEERRRRRRKEAYLQALQCEQSASCTVL